MKHPVDEHRLLLQGARNLRDLGGYRTEDGRVTRKGLFFRSDSTARLTDEDIRAIRDAGVSLAVDLRSPSEAEHSPSRLRGVMGIDYRVVPLYDGIHSAMFEGKLPDSLGEMYIELLEESKERMAELFRLFLAATGASLFHCAAGKDRTGVVAMLLLKLARVPDETVILDYSVTERYIEEFTRLKIEELHSRGIFRPDDLMYSAPENMERLLSYLHTRYGDAESYLRSCGLDGEELAGLQARWLD